MTDQLAQIAWIARLALALVFIWHGLVPKILWLSPDEVAMISAHGLPAHGLFAPEVIARLGGIAEMMLGSVDVSSRAALLRKISPG
ncbi:MAG: DoxX-like family protein [Gammaproteobacteria bacterium]|nr:DoxX-like family protein [Gammaproteobacteria bacterium]MBU1492202.1 DoxX-like family protein [Gammaproteobacteria bacterium]MBU2065502.1 DoxX-like family protein [Gammaproteobacteria bacterium]MBU2140507.1 DoxX-like family protein [Gammaproteobacteria bacterium]MBU2218393.1 DoxX-like family protein [Gammaproteobacteria bacterium]